MVFQKKPGIPRQSPLPAIALSIFALLLLSGCVLYNYRTGEVLSDTAKLKVSDGTIDLSTTNTCSELNVSQPCSCMVCKNKTSGTWFWYESSLKEGECRFDNCNATSFAETVKNGKSIQPRYFMIGEGPSFASAKAAFPYCNYSFQLATKWMKAAAPGSAPRMQSPSRAACWLDRGILPVYIYYTGGTRIDPSWMGSFAKSLNDAKAYPSIIVTEMNFDSSTESNINAVRQQIVQIKRNCPNCLSVLGVRSRDYDAVNKILGDPNVYLNNRNMSSLTDMVGFGFLANDYTDCNPPAIIGANIQFSRFVLMNHSKPTLWLYVGASEGNNTGQNCDFSNQTVHDFYQKVFSSIPGLASSGVVGMSFYEFTDRTGPLPCVDGQGCDYGVLLSNGSQKQPEINSWASLCQFVATDASRNPVMFSRNGRGFVCDIYQNWNIYTQISTGVNTELGLKTSEVAPLPKVKGLTCGESCISDSKNPLPDLYGGMSAKFNSSHCGLFPSIEEYADEQDISSTYVRALLEQESGFNQYARSCEPISNSGCNTGRPTTGSDNRNYYTAAELCSLAGVPSDQCPAECAAGKKPCAFGLAQCIDYPGKHFTQTGTAMPQWVAMCGGANYNPFNPGNSVCCGVNKFASYLGGAQAFISSHWGELSACDDGMEAAEKPWAAYYLASNRYYGTDSYGTGTGSAFAEFLNKRDTGGSCKGGEQNYIRFLRLRKPAVLNDLRNVNDPRNEYGAAEMSRYFSAVDVCESDCPGK